MTNKRLEEIRRYLMQPDPMRLMDESRELLAHVDDLRAAATIVVKAVRLPGDEVGWDVIEPLAKALRGEVGA